MKKITLFNLLPGELAAVVQRILNFLVLFVAGDPALKTGYDVVMKNLNILKMALSKDKKSQYTIKLLEKDVERDDAFIVFRDSVKILLKNPDHTKREKAKNISAIIKKYGYTLHRLPYVQQTDVMDRMLAELKQPANLQVLEELGLTDLLKIMDATAIAFEALRQEKVDEETRLELARVYLAFRELSGDVKDFVKYLALLNKGNYKPELSDIISSIEKELTDAAAAAKARSTRKEKQKPAA